MILYGNRAHCSGTLINNTAQDGTPYLLTAYHCLEKNGIIYDPSQFVFIFNYETDDCEGENPTQTYSINGAAAVAKDIFSDFALLLLNDRPPADWNLYYAGWNRKDVLYKGAVVIHHPRGDWKKISEDRKTLASGKFYNHPDYPDNTHYVAIWDTGTTENGSSGSGLFNREKLLIGQLEGGAARCNNLNGEDWFGKISYSWTNNNNPDSNRLDYWLDPLGWGVELLGGIEADSFLNVKNHTKQEDIISIYPNPTNGKLKIESGELKIKNLIVYDIIGKIIINETDIQNNEFILDIEKLHAGLYLLKIETEKGFFMKKMVKR